MKWAVTEHHGSIGVWSADEWEEAAASFVNTRTDWFDTKEEAEVFAQKRREHNTPNS